MSENPSKSAPLPVIIAVLALFSLFFFAVRYFYGPRETGTFVGDGIHTAELRKKNLAELHAKEKAQSTTYGWVNEKDKVVRLPIDRAMELTLQKYAARK